MCNNLRADVEQQVVGTSPDLKQKRLIMLQRLTDVFTAPHWLSIYCNYDVTFLNPSTGTERTEQNQS